MRAPGSSNYVRREIGEVGALSLADARTTAREWLLLIKQGIDPKVHARQTRALAATARDNSFRHVAEAFIARHLKGQRTGARTAREVRNELISHWGDLPITSITRQMVVELVEAVVDRGGKRHAHTIFSHVQIDLQLGYRPLNLWHRTFTLRPASGGSVYRSEEDARAGAL